ncbi:dynein axonemal assembly factor 11 [Chanos chanos]|uniref:Leucine-rich repeat-containing protein 6 n=1 Tax=Chanos chanos TaxID=29144 RepID=A0A6J2VKC4_CHACN|nr:protein tilB homolog [Chanos chanos]
MVRVTEELIRRRAEHNNCEIFTLEEVSLHQQDIERIEHIDKWCRDLKILYLQNNLIPKIENVGKLKKLEYLNLALNNIEVIENLEGCESLVKLDLTLNFVGRLSSVGALRENLHLKELFLVGNPCTEFQGYRQYVVACLPQLQCLDGSPIGRAERIRAQQDLDVVRRRVQEQEEDYVQKREKQKREGLEKSQRPGSERDEDSQSVLCSENTDVRDHQSPGLDSESEQTQPSEEQGLEQRDREFWEKPCAFTPESRLEAHHHLEEKRRAKEREREKPQKVKPRTLITAEGRVLNVNEAKLDFTLTDDEESNCVLLDLHVYRHMDTSLLDVHVQPTYLRVTVKGKVFQLVLPAEVKPDSSTAQRSQTTGHLLVTMPKAHGDIKPKKFSFSHSNTQFTHRPSPERECMRKRERLEVEPGKHSAVDLASLTLRGDYTRQQPLRLPANQQLPATKETPISKDFVDNPDVPPLI